MVRVMTIKDYDQVHALWMRIKGFAIRSIDDSREGVARFIRRNPTSSVVAVVDGKIVGAILCGHDGRRGCLYHVCVDPEYRRRGIGKEMVVFCMEALKKEDIMHNWFLYKYYDAAQTQFCITGCRKTSDTTWKIPEEIGGKPVTAISSGAFCNRDDVETVYIPDSVSYVGCDAFRNCKNLNSVIFYHTSLLVFACFLL